MVGSRSKVVAGQPGCVTCRTSYFFPLSVVVLDWIVVGRAPANARWWFPLTWLVFPLAYLAFYLVYVGDGPPLYPFLRPGSERFLIVVFRFLVGVLGIGYLMYGIAKLRGALSRVSNTP